LSKVPVAPTKWSFSSKHTSSRSILGSVNSMSMSRSNLVGVDRECRRLHGEDERKVSALRGRRGRRNTGVRPLSYVTTPKKLGRRRTAPYFGIIYADLSPIEKAAGR
jgi:hypothetical protein